MLDAVRRYATKILLIHLVLLVLVIFFVLGAARQVQVSAREQAQTESRERLQLLAEQTAVGLETHYQSIMQDLDVILREESTTTAPAATGATTAPVLFSPPDAPGYPDRGGGQGRGRGRGTTQPGGRILGQGRGLNGRGNFLTGPVVVNERTLNTLWRQLKGRVSQLFLVDTATQRVLSSFPADSATADASAVALTRANIAWLKTVKDSEMSNFKLADNTAIGDHTGYHLVVVPAVETGGGGGGGGPGGGRGPGGVFGGPEFGGPGRGPGPGGGPGGQGGPGGPGFAGGPGGGPNGSGPGGQGGLGATVAQTTRMVVAVVPIDKVRELFLDHLNDRQNHEVSAILVNDAGQVLVSSSLRAVGSNLLDQMTGETREKLATLVAKDDATDVLSEPFQIGDTAWAPQVIASAQLEVPSGHHWTVLILSPLADVENAVNRVFSSALLWAVVVSLSMTGILVSTSVFMIRSRVRLERTRHDILTRELEQARQIQLAWLPDLASTPPDLEVWAANLPASHISGDFYNWFHLPRRAGQTDEGGESSKIGIVIGDVTGHGMAAAFLMATTQLLVRMTLTRHHDAARCLREVNQQLCTQAGGGFRGQFVTMLVMVLDPLSHSIEVATAGHPTPLVETRDGFKPLELEPQLVLGVDAKEEYKAQGFILEPGASVLLYTDGVVEAEAESGEQFGVERLVKVLAAQTPATSDPEHRIRAVLEGVKKFSGQRDLLDDVTLVAIRTNLDVAPI